LSQADIRRALSRELDTRGYEVAGDTVGLRGDLYIRGAGDRASALFEFKTTGEEACRTMYQGSWLPSLPPRFAVLPAVARDDPGVDILTQSGLRALFYRVDGEQVTFEDLDAALAGVDSFQ